MFDKILKNKLFKETALYTLINIIDKSIPFILLPIYAKILTKSDLGVYMLYQALFQIFIPILTLSMDQGILLNYYHKEKQEFQKYFTNVIFGSVFIFIILSLIVKIFDNQISILIDFSVKGIYIIVATILFQFLYDILTNLYRLERKPKMYGLVSISQTVLKNGIGFLLVFYLTKDWYSLALGNLFGTGIIGLVSLIVFYKKDLIHFNFKNFKNDLKDAFRISYPLSIHKIAAWLGNTINRVIINKRLGSKFTASFGVGSTFNVILTILIDSMNKSYAPDLFEKLKNLNDEIRYQIVKITFNYYLIIIFLSVVICILGYFFVDVIFGVAYLDTRKYIVPLTLAAGLNGLYKLHSNFIFFTKKTIYITIITFSTALINVPLAYIFIGEFGILGAVYSLLLTNFLYYVLVLIFSYRLIKINWILNIKKMIYAE